MVPISTKTPIEDAAAADAIFTTDAGTEEGLESLFTNSLDSLLNKVIGKALGRLNVLYTVGKMVYNTSQENIEKKTEEEAAYDLITIGLQNPSLTVEDHSEFKYGDHLQDDNSEARYFVMIPKPLEKTHYKYGNILLQEACCGRAHSAHY